MLCKIEISNAVHGSDSDYCTVVLVDDVFGRLPELHDVPASQLYKYLETSTEEMVCNFSLDADTNRFETVDGAPFGERVMSVQDILNGVGDRFNDFILGVVSDCDNSVTVEVFGKVYCIPRVIKCGGGVEANLFLYGYDAKDGYSGAAIYYVPDQGYMVLSARWGCFSFHGLKWGWCDFLSEDAARALVVPVGAGLSESNDMGEPFSGPVGDLEGLDVEAIQEDMQWAHDKLIRRINETYRVLNMYCDVGKGEPGLIVHSGDYVSYGVDASGYPLGQYEIIDADLNDIFHELGFDEIVLCGADKDHVGCHKTSDESLTVYVDLAADYVRGFKSHIGKK